MVKKNYEEGSWFAVPLKPKGFAVGLAARNTPRGAGILAYFFDKHYQSPPALSELEHLEAKDALRVLQIGDLGLINGEWKVIGKQPNWDRSKWPVPNFIRREPITGRVWQVTLSNDDPAVVVSEKLVSEEQAAGSGPHLIYGYGAVEKVLSKLLL